MNLYARGAALLSWLLLTQVCVADEAATFFVWTAGVETSSGKYGGDADIDELYVPLTLTIDGERIAVDLTIPYLSVRAPAETPVVDPSGPSLPASDDRVTQSGLGDVVVGLTVYDVFYAPEFDLALDLSGRVKLGTADVDKGLGTGETDVTVVADLLKFFDQGMLIASAGYKFRGQPEGYELEDGLLASFGGTLNLSMRNRVGAFFDYRESAIAGEDAITELSLFLERRLAERLSLQFFVHRGFSDSAADWGGGVLIRAM